MSSRAFVVPLADLENGPKSVEWTLSQSWLADAFSSTEATPVEPGTLEVELSKNGPEVLVRGRVTVSVTMPCARTLEPVSLTLSPDIYLLLSRAAPAPRQPKTAKARPRDGVSKTGTGSAPAPEAKKKGYRAWVDDPELADGDAAEDHFEGEQIVLDDFVREFLVLDLPMNPVRSDLPPDDFVAIPRPPVEPGRVSALDPRLAPLAVIAERMKKQEN